MATKIPKQPDQWKLGRKETITSFECWQQNLIHALTFNPNFSQFLLPECSWSKKTATAPNRGLVADVDQTAEQKLACLELMLGHIANYCPLISRNAIVKNSTSIQSVWQTIRLHYNIQREGGRFLDFTTIKLEPDESPEDLFQRLSAFVDDNLITAGDGIKHHGQVATHDEETTPSLENMIVCRWLELINPLLPKFVRQRYGTQLRDTTLATIRPEISIALQSLLDELQSSEDIRVLRTAGSKPRNPQPTQRRGSYSNLRKCPLCDQAGRPALGHFLSECRFLPDSDRKYITSARNIETDDIDTQPPETVDSLNINNPPSALSVLVRPSPYIDVFSDHQLLRLTLDSGCTANMIRADVARILHCKISSSSQVARQADGSSKLNVIGETSIPMTRDHLTLTTEALVVDNLDVEFLAGTTFMESNDITLRPSKRQVIFGDGTTYEYGRPQQAETPISTNSPTTIARATHNNVILPGECAELHLSSINMWPDGPIAIEPHGHRHGAKWPNPSIVPCLSGKFRVKNDTHEPILLKKHEHLCQVYAATSPAIGETKVAYPGPRHTRPSKPTRPHHASHVILDPDNILSEQQRNLFRLTNREYDVVFDPEYPGYNGRSGPFTSKVNMGPTLPPQRKGHCPQYSRNKLTSLQEKFDELESLGVFVRPEDANINVEYLNPSFLIQKSDGKSFRLVTSFGDVAKYAKPQPSLLGDVDSILRQIGRWTYIIKADLTSAFYQIPLSRDSMKYCGVSTPFRGTRVYARSAMGMPGSETALEELMCRVLGDLLTEGIVIKIADDLFCGANTPEVLSDNWRRTLYALSSNGLRLSAQKTTICPRTITILGWIWTRGSLSASPHRVSALASTPLPERTRALRSFIGAYKFLARVMPGCAQLLAPLDDLAAGKASNDKITWSTQATDAFHRAQEALSSTKHITIPRTDDQLWIVTDGSIKQHSIGGTLYAERNGKLHIAGYFSAKLRERQDRWLPCEIEAASIAASIKHWSPYLIQSSLKPHVLTDSKPCVQAYNKLCRGQFSLSPRVTTFLSTASRFQAIIRHLPGASNMPSDYASRNAPECLEPTCQICQFVRKCEDMTVLKTNIDDILSNQTRLPFTSRHAWSEIQSECRDLRRTHAHLTQGTRPSKKQTNARDVKRYLNRCEIATDGLIIVRSTDPLTPIRDRIVIPRSSVHGLMTSLHLQLNHPSETQLLKVTKRYLFALDHEDAVHRATIACHTCNALKTTPKLRIPQTSEPPPNTIGQSFAADVMCRPRQKVLVVRETVTSYTTACTVPDERHDTLQAALIRLCSPLIPLEGPDATVRTDNGPGFQRLVGDKLLHQHRIQIELGHPKFTNKNPVAEAAIREFEEQTSKLYFNHGILSDTDIALVTNSLNTIIRKGGMSAREALTRRDQFNNEHLLFTDNDLIKLQQVNRLKNHKYSERSKAPNTRLQPHIPITRGDLVYLFSDRQKHTSRPRYIVTHTTDQNLKIRKFIGDQLRNKTYHVKREDCYLVTPKSEETHYRHDPPESSSSDEEYNDTKSETYYKPSPQAPGPPQAPLSAPHPTPAPEIPTEIVSPQHQPEPQDQHDTSDETSDETLPIAPRRSTRTRRRPDFYRPSDFP